MRRSNRSRPCPPEEIGHGRNEAPRLPIDQTHPRRDRSRMRLRVRRIGRPCRNRSHHDCHRQDDAGSGAHRLRICPHRQRRIGAMDGNIRHIGGRWPRHRADQRGSDRLPVSARHLPTDIGQQRGRYGSIQGGCRESRSSRRHRRPAQRSRQLLRRARQCARGQRPFLSCGQRPTIADRRCQHQGDGE